MPLQDGNSWTYAVDGVAGLNRTVLPGTVLVNGAAAKVLEYAEGSALYLTNDENGIRQHRSDTTLESNTYSPPVTLANPDSELGRTVNSSGTITAVLKSNPANPVTLYYSASSTPVRFEVVTVPAGVFTTLLLQTNVSASGTVNGQTVSLSSITYSWAAKNIGVVKQQVQATGQAATTALLHATNVALPASLGVLSGTSRIAAGSRHSLAAAADGSVWAWGSNARGQLGDGTTGSRNSPAQIGGLGKATAVAAGESHSLALMSDGSVWAWGGNGNGELGQGTTSDQASPVQVGGLNGVIAIAAGASHSLALKSDGGVWAWGRNYFGQLGNGSTLNSASPVQVNGLSGVVAVAAGVTHSLALKSDGTVWAWGSNLLYQLGTGASTADQQTTPVQVASNLGGAVAIAAGGLDSLALIADRYVFGWGNNGTGQLGLPTTTPSEETPNLIQSFGDATAIAASYHTVAIKSDGSVWTWGVNGTGQLGRAANSYSDSTPGQVGGLSEAIAVAAAADLSAVGSGHSLALRADGTVWAWGQNFDGQLGPAASTLQSSPVMVPGLNLGPLANLARGWNLLGNGFSGTLDVPAVFGDASSVTSVWKWIAAKSAWAFYTPTLPDGGVAYATSKGYDAMTSVAAGEGFWVNARSAFKAQLPAGSAIAFTTFQTLAPGWNLIAIGESKSPSQFNALAAPATPVTSLWAWDSAQSNWYFYAPSLDADGGLSAYIINKGYLDFGATGKTMGPGVGFWVNKP